MPTAPTLQSLLETLAAHAEQPAVLALRKSEVACCSYRALADQVTAFANRLAAAGVKSGQQVAILAENRPAWIAACLAVIQTGAVVVPVDVQLADETLRQVLEDSDAKCVFTTPHHTERLARLGLDRKPHLILLDQPHSLPGAGEPITHFPARPDDIAALFYTSGTTGRPKGVPLTHANLAFELEAVRQMNLITPTDRLLLPLPLHHVYPFVIGMLLPLVLGVPIVMPRALTGPEIIRALREGGVTVVLGVPRLYRALYGGIVDQVAGAGRIARWSFRGLLALSLALRRRLGLRVGRYLFRPLHRRLSPTVRIMASGGAALDPALAWKLEALGWQVSIGYGLTETSPLLTLNPPGAGRLDSVGRAIPGVELRLDRSGVAGGVEAEPAASRECLDKLGTLSEVEALGPPDSGDTQPPAEGEVLARGPNVFGGYRQLPDETKRAFTDGWFRTGDLGYFDADGWLYLTGRLSTLIVTEGGKNIQPDALEEAYQAHPVIREIGVFQDNHQLVALVVPRLSQLGEHGTDKLEDTVRAAVKERSRQLPSYQRVTAVAVTREPLPRTRLGKIQRQELIDRYRAAQAGGGRAGARAQPLPVDEMSSGDRALVETPAGREVWELLTRRYPLQGLTPASSPQLDLGIDSLEWLRLTLEIGRRTGVELSEEAIARIDTVHDLLDEVAQASAGGEGESLAEPLTQPERALSADQKRWLAPLSPVQRTLATILYAVSRAIMKSCFRLRVQGREGLPADGPFVLTPNHTSYLDPFALGAALDTDQLQRLYWAGWTGAVFRNPVLRFFSRLGQTIPINPERAVVSSLAFCAAVLQRGNGLVWFPEGGRSSSDQLQPFRPGIGLLLEHFAVPVVPVYIDGAQAALPVGRAWPRFRRITVVFGKPLEPAELKAAGQGENDTQRIVTALQQRVAGLRPAR